MTRSETCQNTTFTLLKHARLNTKCVNVKRDTADTADTPVGTGGYVHVHVIWSPGIYNLVPAMTKYLSAPPRVFIVRARNCIAR